MFTFEFSINAIMLLGIILLSAFVGFSFRRKQIAKVHKKLVKAENEMISSHAEVLELQKEYMAMELKLRGVKDPIVIISNAFQPEEEEKLPNGTLRKKMLTKDLTPTRTEGYQIIYNNMASKQQEARTGS
jgi:IMP dehydrogenase/GMP reductase